MSTVYEVITDQIIKKLESGVVPWKQPWKHYIDGSIGIPTNFITKKPYRGINAILLSSFDLPFFASYKQWSSKGGQVKKGARGIPVVYWLWKDKEQAKKDKSCPCFPRYYTVFNVADVENITLPEQIETKKSEPERLADCELLLASVPDMPVLTHNGSSAHYNSNSDLINMPKIDSFNRITDYYAVLFHELTHSTGHKSRLDRDLKNQFGSDAYAKEELIAELGASFLCNLTGIDHIEQSASYIQSWLRALKNDSKLVMQAASKAAKATDWLNNKSYEATESEAA